MSSGVWIIERVGNFFLKPTFSLTTAAVIIYWNELKEVAIWFPVVVLVGSFLLSSIGVCYIQLMKKEYSSNC